MNSEVASIELAVWLDEADTNSLEKSRVIKRELGECLVLLEGNRLSECARLLLNEFSPDDPYICGGVVAISRDCILGGLNSISMKFIKEWPGVIEGNSEIWIANSEKMLFEEKNGIVWMTELWGDKNRGRMKKDEYGRSMRRVLNLAKQLKTELISLAEKESPEKISLIEDEMDFDSAG